MITASPATDLPQTPATIADEQIGLNGAIAMTLTRSVGSMPALYAALVIVGGWMALATWGPLHRLDPYPFRFLLFLDNVAQLVLCLVILVGQRLLGVAADHRAVQTYENAEAIFEQVVDLQEHLDRHDRVAQPGSQPAGVEPASLDRAAPGGAAAPGHRPGGHRQRADRGLADEAAGHHAGLLSGGRDPDRLDRAGGDGRSAVRPVSVRLHVVPVHPGPAHLHDRDHGRPGRAQPGRRPPLRADLPRRQGHPPRVPADEGEADETGPDPRQPHQLRRRPGDRAPGAGHPR